MLDTLKTKTAISRLIHKDNAHKFMPSLRGWPPYFEVSKKLMASICQLGPATFFMTLPAAETRWSHLLKMLSFTVDKKELSKEEITELNWKENCRLIVKDPITCARNFDFMTQQLLTVLKNSKNLLGDLQDYFLRNEFANQLSVDLNGLLWIKGAPRCGIDENCVVIAFVDRYITCKVPDNDPEPYDLVSCPYSNINILSHAKGGLASLVKRITKIKEEVHLSF